MSIAVIGAGAFGTALGMTLAQGGTDVAIWGRNLPLDARESPRLADIAFPNRLRATTLETATKARILLLALPAQTLGRFAEEHAERLNGHHLVACCKGIDLTRGIGPTGLLQDLGAQSLSILTGPSFAADIARGLPSALTLACADAQVGRALQHALSTPALRLYLTDDVPGAELGGALKNVIAIACGAAMGAGLGASARAALMTRGFAEIQRLAPHWGARPDTLAGLSGLGDLALTCTSDLSRNYRHGTRLGRGEPPEPGVTIEGVATARAAAALAHKAGVEMPITETVAALAAGEIDIKAALTQLMSRPLKEE